MMNSFYHDVDGIGPVCFCYSRRARRIIISVGDSKGVRVSIPRRTSFSKALEFIDLKKGWIQKHLAKIKHNENQKKELQILLQPIDKETAEKKIKERLVYLAGLHGFKYNKITIRAQKTRWGSCSPNNNISLNFKLVLLPESLSDYVILHELVHTRIHNHSKKFWIELDLYVKNSKTMAKRLRTEGMALI